MKAALPAMALILFSAIAFAQGNTTQILTNLSNTHIREIANGNLSAAEGGYVSFAFVFVNMNSTSFSDDYYGSQGIAAALLNITSYGTPYSYYIRNTSVDKINSTAYSMDRDIWFVSKNQSYTLQIPYSATYVYRNETWLIEGEWFGIPMDSGAVYAGMQAPVNSTTTTIITTASTTTVTNNATTSLQYTIFGQSSAQQGQQNSSSATSQAQQPGLLEVVFAILAIAIIALYFLMMRKKS